MKLLPWRRNDELTAFRDEFDELFNRFFTDEPLGAMTLKNGSTFLPPMNLAETDKTFAVTIEVPGMTEKDVHVEVRGRELVVTGERKWEEEKKGKEFRRVESWHGSLQETRPAARRTPDCDIRNSVQSAMDEFDSRRRPVLLRRSADPYHHVRPARLRCRKNLPPHHGWK